MDQFVMVLGNRNEVLNGTMWTEYRVDVNENEMVCSLKSNPSCWKAIPYSCFTYAEFGIGNGNLWLQCKVEGKWLVFCSPRKCWKSEQAKLLIDKINAVTPIKDMKEYKQYTGPLFFLAMFK